jgi:hypothetical protein
MIYVDSINDTSQVGVQIKSLTSTPVTTLEDGLIQWYKFQKEDFDGTSLYDHVSKSYITTALRNGATYSTTIKNRECVFRFITNHKRFLFDANHKLCRNYKSIYSMFMDKT